MLFFIAMIIAIILLTVDIYKSDGAMGIASVFVAIPIMFILSWLVINYIKNK